MKEFINKSVLFAVLLIASLSTSLFFIHDKNSSENILAALPGKYSHLDSISGGRIIFVGGSNLSFGLNSKQVQDSLKKPVVNLGVHAGMGLRFIASDVLKHIHPDDIIVLVPEYENFYTDNFYGEIELISVLFDILPQSRKEISFSQWLKLANYLPVYSAKKIKNFMSFSSVKNSNEINVYDKRSFNSYGDAYIHWTMENQDFLSLSPVESKTTNTEVFDFLKSFTASVKSKKAKVLLFPPVIEKQSFLAQMEIINIINLRLKSEQLDFCVAPENYSYERNYFFNSYYHLNKTGVDKRTLQIIEDLKKCTVINE